MEHKKEEKSDRWIEVGLEFVKNTLSGLGKNIADHLHQKMRAVVAAVMRRVVAALLFAIGVVFVLVGAARWINTIAGNEWMGNIAVGAGALILAAMISWSQPRYE